MGLGASILTGLPGIADAEFGAASQVEVHERLGEATTYAIRLPVTAKDGDLSWLADTRVAPGQILSVYISQASGEVCLVRGPVTGHAARLAHGGAGSYVDILGADASIALDRVHRTRIWQDASDADAVSAIVGEAGFAPDVAATPSVQRSDLRSLAQADTDLRFVRRLARRNGYIAWLSTDANTGSDTFHFRPPPVDGAAVATLSVNQPGANTQTIDVRWDSERPTSVDARQIDLTSGGDLDATGTRSPTRALGAVRFADAVPKQSLRLVAPADDSAAVQARAEGAAREAEWFVQASLETTLAAVGAAVRAHALVLLQGAGSLHSGSWLVAGVRHLIDATGHRMTVDLIRNAWGA